VTDSGVYFSSDTGVDWLNIGMTNVYLNAFAVSGAYLYAGLEFFSPYDTNAAGVYLSTNNGEDWTAIGLLKDNIYSLCAAGGNLLAVTDSGIFITTNNGITWNAMNDDFSAQYVHSFVQSGANIFALSTGGAFLSNDNGTSWKSLGILWNSDVTSLASFGSYLFVVTEFGLFLSSDNGLNWYEACGNVIDTFNDYDAVCNIAIADTNLFIGTRGYGVWRRSISDVIQPVNLQHFSATPAQIQLGQNYPNPFDATTTFEYFLLQAAPVLLLIYNELGSEVASSFFGIQAAGMHTVTFQDYLPKGNYFYWLLAGSSRQMGKMTVFR